VWKSDKWQRLWYRRLGWCHLCWFVGSDLWYWGKQRKHGTIDELRVFIRRKTGETGVGVLLTPAPDWSMKERDGKQRWAEELKFREMEARALRMDSIDAWTIGRLFDDSADGEKEDTGEDGEADAGGREKAGGGDEADAG
jgi:hypothetical protein